LGVALWLAGYEQGRTGDLQLTPAGIGSTHLNVTRQTPTALGGQDTTVALSAAGLVASSYSVVLHNTSANSSNWYIPNLSGIQTGASSDWSVRITLNEVDITSDVMGNGGFTFNASAITTNAGLVMDPGVQQTLTFTFDPLNANAASDPYSFDLTGLAHPGASDAFGSVTFSVTPTVSLVLAGANVAITYTGTLVSSTNVAGPYNPVTGASSPYSTPATNAQMFYRTHQ
jgi:hypothetical protein